MGNILRMMAVVLVFGFTVSMANEPGQGGDEDSVGMSHHMMGGPRHGGFGHPGMMPGMMRTQMLPSSDGGVIVLRGGTLYKYDKDLNLKKQVELPRPQGWAKFRDGKDSGMMMEHRHWHHGADGDSSKPAAK